MSDDGRDREQVLEMLRHRPDDVVHEKLALPSALWARAVLEKPDDVPVTEYLERLIYVGLSSLETLEGRDTHTAQVDVELEREQWERLRLDAAYSIQRSGRDPETAFWDNVNEHVETVPNIVVDGETVGPEDVAPGACEDGDGDRDE
ncbi:hypothetical protein ACLI4Z_19235 (plasmid) [Natrialbaceae archaeon A-arb3/5]